MHNWCAQKWEIHFQCTVTVQIVQTVATKSGLMDSIVGLANAVERNKLWFSARNKSSDWLDTKSNRLQRLIEFQMYGGHLTNAFNRHIYDNYMTLNIYGTYISNIAGLKRRSLMRRRLKRRSLRRRRLKRRWHYNPIKEISHVADCGQHSRCHFMIPLQYIIHK